MIYPAKYNGINFSYDFTRNSNYFDANIQREINIISETAGSIFFFYPTLNITAPSSTLYSSDSSFTPIAPISAIRIEGGFLYSFRCPVLTNNSKAYFILNINNEIIYSEYCIFIDKNKLKENNICSFLSMNDDDRYGYLSDPAFGFFRYSELNSDVFSNKSTVYEYSYSRKLILSSENQITKKLTFLNLSMYQQNLLKWLCNCQTVYINDKVYQLISDFNEVSKSDGLETCDLQATFVEAKQSFFSEPSTKTPKILTLNNLFN